MSDKPKDPTRKARQASYRERGRVVSCVLTDEAAQAKLLRLEEKHGGVKAAIEAALRGARV